LRINRGALGRPKMGSASFSSPPYQAAGAGEARQGQGQGFGYAGGELHRRIDGDEDLPVAAESLPTLPASLPYGKLKSQPAVRCTAL
jgi:hypothetical protein